MKLRHATLALCAGMVWSATPCYAASEEIQVYQDEIGPRGAIGLDVHLNYVAQGDDMSDYFGQESALHAGRITPEFSLGLGGGFEAGLYLPLATVARDSVLRVQGIKARMKWIAPRDKIKGFYWGGNFEIGRVSHALDVNPWNAEFKAIAGWRRGKFSAAVNGNFDFVVSGPAASPATVEIATKVAYRVMPNLALGVESYNGIGALKSLGRLGDNEHASYFVADGRLGKWDINFGIGKGYGTNRDHVIVKFVIGVPLP